MRNAFCNIISDLMANLYLPSTTDFGIANGKFTFPYNSQIVYWDWLLANDSSFIFCLLSQVVEKSRAGFIRTEAFLEAYVDSFVEQTGNVHKALLWVLTQPEYEEFCVSCKTTS